MEFTPGVNIIVGKNNVGKTSLLEVLTLDFEDQQHRSLKTLPNKGVTLEEESKIAIIWEISTEEVRNFIKQFSPNVGIPALKGVSSIGSKDQYQYEDEDQNEYEPQEDPEDQFERYMSEALQQFNKKLEHDSLEIQFFLFAGRKIKNKDLEKLLNFESFPTEFKSDGNSFYRIEYKDNEKISFSYDITKDTEDGDIYRHRSYKAEIYDSIGYQMFNTFSSSIYKFKAERLNIGICKFENNEQLKSDASNLAEVICILQGKNPGMFAKFNKLVSEIMEEIKWISVVPRDNSNVEIIVWTLDTQLNRDDLSLPLSSCGSGVGQVLAIVYILVSSEEPRTLIIDEPQSFLHPGAAKKLIETIKQFPKHQYFIATHSPDIITTADPSNIIKLKYENCETTASVIHEIDIKSQKEILDELGVRLSDVFGADSVLWVEGPTEEKCFPLIIDKFLAEMPLKGMKILRVDSVSGLLDGKHASLVARLHKQLTSGISLIPEKSIFIFDREGKTVTQVNDLKRIGFNFLKRPMYENYILHPEAISVIINEEREKILAEIGVENADSKWLKSPITSTQVQECFDKIQQEEKCLLKGVENDNWFFKVHGADVIQSVFQELCENQLDFNGNKPKYCLQITEWIIKHQPEFLSKLSKELKECLNQNK
jgi:predicted ATP-dependent endonuclease of OLD family